MHRLLLLTNYFSHRLLGKNVNLQELSLIDGSFLLERENTYSTYVIMPRHDPQECSIKFLTMPQQKSFVYHHALALYLRYPFTVRQLRKLSLTKKCVLATDFVSASS